MNNARLSITPSVAGRVWAIQKLFRFFLLGAALYVPAIHAQVTGTDMSELEGFRADTWYLPDDPLLGFVPVPAGTFQMGSNPLIDPMAFENERWSEGRRQGVVDLPLYYMSKFEVTVAQFRTFVQATGHRVDPSALEGGLNHPVVHVSWTDALAYGRWLQSVLLSDPDAPAQLRELLNNGWTLTLPDEAQWEKAARGDDGRIFPWGNQPDRSRSNVSSSGTVPVGSRSCADCSYGLSDMSGNVWEWTRSPYQPLPFDPSDDAQTIGEDALWVMRGGSFNDAENNARAAVRGAADPGARRAFIGFRLALVRL